MTSKQRQPQRTHPSFDSTDRLAQKNIVVRPEETGAQRHSWDTLERDPIESHSRKIIAILTLEKHKDGIWIVQLMKALQILCESKNEKLIHGLHEESLDRIKHVLYTLESLHLNQFSPDQIPMDWICVVNRVSDAADPIQAKACQAILHAAALWNIPVFNGAQSYGIGSNKWLHHQVFTRSHLAVPRSVLISKESSDSWASYKQKCMEGAIILMKNYSDVRFPLLMKPNSGGFGQGIRYLETWDDLYAAAENIYNDPTFLTGDGVILLQEFIAPYQDKVYRVWFLDGKVQCAVERRFEFGQKSATSTDEKSGDLTMENSFSGGCAGSKSLCSLGTSNDSIPSDETWSGSIPVPAQPSDNTNNFIPWHIPNHIAREIESMLPYIGSDCHAGSVEFLCKGDENQRIYFDLNMLSTLPVAVFDENKNDGSDQLHSNDPWMELALSVLRLAINS